jgi:PKD repeat protein
MKSFKSTFLLAIAIMVHIALFAQTEINPNYHIEEYEISESQKLTVQTAKYFDVSKPLTEMSAMDNTTVRKWKDGIVKNNFRRVYGNGPLEPVNDPTWQKEMGSKATLDPIQNFDGANNGDNAGGVAPPDTQGDVGPNHYVQMVNNVTEIFDKSGTTLWGPLPSSTFWSGFNGSWTGTNDGDPIVLYDQQADRWLVSQFAVNTSDGTQWELIAISQTGDPTGSYYRYAFQFTNMPDYPKIGIWPDGYYLSANRFPASGGGFLGTYAAAMERSLMLTGSSSAQMILFTNGNYTTDPYAMLPSDCDGTFPPVGTPNYFCFDNDNNTYWTADRLKVWAFTADWTTPANSSFVANVTLVPASFNSSFSSNTSISQPVAQGLDPLADRMMFRAQYRTFSGHQSIVLCRTVNMGSNKAGIRWYELRKTTGNWYIYQQGTYAPDSHNRWMGSIAMNGSGDIALGYSVSSSSVYPSIRYTGRLSSDPLGTMSIAETSIHSGTSGQSGVHRWGDYSMMSVDPSDDHTFWYTTEYTSGNWNWRTRIASFYFTAPTVPPVADFSASTTSPLPGETVILTDLSAGVPTSWNWTITPSSFVYVNGTDANSQNPEVQFSELIPYSVSLSVTNPYGSDTETKPNYINVTNCTNCNTYYSNTSDEWISNVSFNTINNASGSTNYSDFTSFSTEVEPGSSHSISVDITVVGSYTEHCIVFFDWNKDCDFSDIGESVDLGQINGSGTLNGLVNVPVDAEPGNVLMRVSMRWNQNPTGCDVTTYGEAEDYTVSILHENVILDLTAFLEGPFNGVDMNTNLGALIPLEQPFDINPWNYPGTESLTSIPNADVVDWVLIDLRDASSAISATGATSVDKRAALLLNDGSIVDLDGSSNLEFTITIAHGLYIVVWHRNHIGILSNDALIPAGGVYVYDFSNGVNQVYGGANAHKQISSGVWGMYSGDGDGNGVINTEDKSDNWENQAGSRGYVEGDYNLDTETNNIDKDEYWIPNIGKGSQVPD